MRLLTKVKKLEREAAAVAAAAEAADARRQPVGLLWTDTEEKLEAALLDALQRGEEVVRDFWILSKHEGATEARARERITRDASDRGRVFDAAGREIGRVISDDGHVVEMDYELGARGQTPGARA